MSCKSPLQAWRTYDGSIIFVNRGEGTPLTLPCGQCIGCRIAHAQSWALRCIHEASLHEHNSFITLTYAPEHLPHDQGLHHDHFQRFIKRFRKFISPTPVRYYMCGEYGEKLGRPHFHALLFGYQFLDLKMFRPPSRSGDALYTSDSLSALWPYGFSTIGRVSFQSAAYIARYATVKKTGRQAKDHYIKIDPDTGEQFRVAAEYNRASLKPGIGARWLKKYISDVYPADRVVFDAGPNKPVKMIKPPRYYDKLLKRANRKLWLEVGIDREERMALRSLELAESPDEISERLDREALHAILTQPTRHQSF